jgi:hypothetical protein
MNIQNASGFGGVFLLSEFDLSAEKHTVAEPNCILLTFDLNFRGARLAD